MTVEDKIGTLAGELRSIVDRKDELEEEIKKLNARKLKIEEEELPRLMEDAEIQNVKFQGIGQLYLDHRMRIRVDAVDSDRLIAYLKENGHGDIVKETVHHKTLESWGKEMWGSGQALPDYVKVHTTPRAILRRK